MKTCSLNKKTFSKLMASSLLFASASWLQAADLQGFFSAGGGVTFDTPKFPRNENLLADPSSQNATLNKVSEYHKTVAPSIQALSSRFNAHRDNKIGLQFFQPLADDISITTQLIAKGYDSNFDFNASWAFLTWQAKSNLRLRTGRLVTPIYMLSEYLEVGFAYPWVRPPLEMYSAVPLNSWSGADITYSGYRGDWDYNFTLALGTVDQDVSIGGVKTPFTTRNGISLNLEGGNDIFRVRAGASRIDILAGLSLDTVDGVVGGAGTLYAGWGVNVLDDTGNISAPDYSNWKSLLGVFESSSVVAGAVSADFEEANNLAFLQGATAFGLASGISAVEPYNETDNIGAQVVKSIQGFNTAKNADVNNLLSFQTIGLGAAATDEGEVQRTVILGAIAGGDLGIYTGLFTSNPGDPGGAADAISSSSDFQAALRDVSNDNSVDVSTGAGVLDALAAAGANLEGYTAAYVGSVLTDNTSNALNLSHAMLGTLTAFDAAGNPGRFNALTQLLNLSGKDLASNYGLVQGAIKSAINQTYLLELKNYLYKTYNQNYRSGSFLSAGFTYDDFNWYSIGEYGYRRLPGFLSDHEGWYLTLGRRFGSLMPHITFSAAYTRDTHVRKTSAAIYAGESDDNKLVTGHDGNNWKNMLNNVRDGVDTTSGSPADYENILFVLDQLEKFWEENQTYHQNSVTVGLRYDWKPGICMKAEVSHYRPKLGCSGFYSVWDSQNKDTGNAFKMSLDAVF